PLQLSSLVFPYTTLFRSRSTGWSVDSAAVVIAFYVLAAMTLISAVMVAMVNNLVHAVLFLILSFVGVAGIYITLSADFVAVVQIDRKSTRLNSSHVKISY